MSWLILISADSTPTMVCHSLSPGNSVLRTGSLVRPVPLRQTLADQDHTRHPLAVSGSEPAATEQGNAECPEIIAAHSEERIGEGQSPPAAGLPSIWKTASKIWSENGIWLVRPACAMSGRAASRRRISPYRTRRLASES